MQINFRKTMKNNQIEGKDQIIFVIESMWKLLKRFTIRILLKDCIQIPIQSFQLKRFYNVLKYLYISLYIIELDYGVFNFEIEQAYYLQSLTIEQLNESVTNYFAFESENSKALLNLCNLLQNLIKNDINPIFCSDVKQMLILLERRWSEGEYDWMFGSLPERYLFLHATPLGRYESYLLKNEILFQNLINEIKFYENVKMIC
ncbi:unnamed protein product [Paramecium sonneborni]|uniref:Uncharacterized protein n=1 Tax=Paramecium sonneborni TaxID=65129 RepID=A0A8S1RVL5_9CILI|nr:unnamed protein product [Paramecium sonneborni]